MIEYNGTSLDNLVVELPTAPPRKFVYPSLMKRRTFYQQHELAIWSVAVSLLLITFYAVLSNNADIIWNLSTPLVRWVP